MNIHDVHGWIIAALLREMAGLEGQARGEYILLCEMRPPRERRSPWPLAQMVQILGNVEPEWMKNKMGVLLETREGQAHQMCSLMQADSCRIMSPSKAHLEMMKGLIEEAERWDLEPKPTSLSWDKHS